MSKGISRRGEASMAGIFICYRREYQAIDLSADGYKKLIQLLATLKAGR